MLGTIATMPLTLVKHPPLDLSDEELELVEQACRSLADRYRRDAEAAAGSSVQAIHLQSQAKLERMAERVRRFRQTACAK